MIELVTGTGLALAAGLNAWIPLLALGLLSRYTDLLTLPGGWSWLENGWVLVVLGVLLLLEVVGDKVPVVDTVNDVVQTVVRPGAGGIAFGAGATAQTARVQDPGAFVESGAWVPVLLGILLALGVHLAKAAVRATANAATGGLAAPLLSTAEDGASVGLSLAAILVPLLVVPLLVGLGIVVWRAVRRRRRPRRDHDALDDVAASPPGLPPTVPPTGPPGR
ncbi:uncharacterized protein DUF4126 [Isoptericola jiangsuensis]|uniref:Uncharacterized protein DUF4126 n=1 Tax=Isoptericola jiangsuensis TaxID=548579 RepID=A0A2A9EVW6_9MICO|nr:DUF4126 domain-containing protein [Isoptericola jiangsuensis]PFG42716.1 uncharacterized protein DUF4126 [Isoptericola jiangsuensis]